jgi:large subunit ribosomal protein L10
MVKGRIQEYKTQEIDSVRQRLAGATAIVLIDYKGINIEEVNELRNRMRRANVDYFVSNNTFIRIALNDMGIKELDPYLEGPTAVAVTKGDEVSAACELTKFVKEVTNDKPFPQFKHGYIGGSVFDAQQLKQLASLPSREELLSKVLAGFNAPISGFVGVLQGIIRSFAYTVQAIADKKQN